MVNSKTSMADKSEIKGLVRIVLLKQPITSEGMYRAFKKPLVA